MLRVIQGGRGVDRGIGGPRGPSGREPPVIAGRPPPHDLDAEAAVLSAILLDARALDEVQPVLRVEHFYSEANARIYEAIEALASAGAPIDIVAVASWLRDRKSLARVGGPAYVAQLADATPAVAHVAAHARVVFEKWRLRALIATCQRFAAEGYGDVGEVQSFLDSAGLAVDALAQGVDDRAVKPAREVLLSFFTTLYAAAERGERLTGTPTGFDRLDAMTAGLHAGDLVIVAGRPGMGKTAFVLNVAVNVASPKKDAPAAGVAFFSLEMPREQIAARLACSEGGVDVARMRSGHLLDDDWRRLTEACTKLARLPLWIDDSPALGLVELRAKVRRIQAEQARAGDGGPKLGLVIVDYLQLMSGNPSAQTREQEISDLSRGLKRLAKELGVPIVALSQLNRAVETRSVKDKRPQLSDLRDSGAVEQDADAVLFVYREEYYFPENDDAKGVAEIIVAKQRNGPTGRVRVRFYAGCTRFEDMADNR